MRKLKRLNQPSIDKCIPPMLYEKGLHRDDSLRSDIAASDRLTERSKIHLRIGETTKIGTRLRTPEPRGVSEITLVLREHRAIKSFFREIVVTEFKERAAEPDVDGSRGRSSGTNNGRSVLKLLARLVEPAHPPQSLCT